jgi:hypothetical protein
VVVCGPKGAGKSTLARLAVNALQAATHQPCGLLDADCGAPEVAPPGCVSLARCVAPLLGAPASRLGAADAPTLLECRFIGDTSPASDPEGYSAALAALLRAWQAVAPSPPDAPLPLVVNTLGWVRGLGLELLAGLLRGAAPTHVLQLRPPGAAPGRAAGLPRGMFWIPHGGVSGAPPPPPCHVMELEAPSRGDPSRVMPASDRLNDDADTSDVADAGDAPVAAPEGPCLAPQRRSATDARALLWAAWAHAAAGADQDAAVGDAGFAALLCPSGAGEAAAFAWTAAALAAARPLAVPAAALPCVALHAAAAPGEAFRLLNGAVVALLAPESSPLSSGDAGAAPRCLGLALVRSVDAAAGMLYLLTPVPPAVAASTRALAVGRLELPAALLGTPQHLSPYLTPWALPSDGSGGAAMRSRNNLERGRAAG